MDLMQYIYAVVGCCLLAIAFGIGHSSDVGALVGCGVFLLFVAAKETT